MTGNSVTAETKRRDALSAHGLDNVDQLSKNAKQAASLLKALSNETRLMILCAIAEEEKTVSQLETLLQMRQPAVSQQLARLRADGLVSTRRDGKQVYYDLASDEGRAIIKTLYDLYCA